MLIKTESYEPKRLEWMAKLDAMGEPAVREMLSLGQAGGSKAAWAQNWIEARDQERLDALESKREASQSEQTEIARSASAAAWSAADAARKQAREAKTANTIATIALIAAVIAIAISIIGIFLKA